MSFKEKLKDYFYFNKGERKGILVLIILIIIAVLINFNTHIFIADNVNDFSQFNKEIEEFENNLISEEKVYESSEKTLNRYATLNLFNFNPNSASENDLFKLGFTEKQIKTLKNYLSKGGHFFYRSDLRKIYGISGEQYEILEPYIDLPIKGVNETSFNRNFSEDYTKSKDIELFFFDPNKISDDEWIKLGFSEKQTSSIRKYINKGGEFKKKEDIKRLYVVDDNKYNELKDFIIIETEKIEVKEEPNYEIDINAFSEDDFINLGGEWKKYAKRIVSFRKILGGFYTKEQLKEVYGFDKQFYKSISDYVVINKSKIITVNINFAEISELSKHPYITYKEAREIIKYRNKNGAYKHLSEIEEKEIISKKTFEKIGPYLTVN